MCVHFVSPLYSVYSCHIVASDDVTTLVIVIISRNVVTIDQLNLLIES